MAAVIDGLLYPLIYLLNRQIFMPLNKLILLFALRLNGCGIAWTGPDGISAAETRFLKSIRKQIVGGTFFDVGANVGHYARALRKYFPKGHIIAFEPHPVGYAKLREATRGLDIRTVELGLSEQAGTALLHDKRGSELSTVASLNPSTLEQFGGSDHSFNVNLTTIDAFCRDSRVERIDFLKIDTEGFDLHVLRGAARMLKERRIGIIEFEFIPACLKTRVAMRDFIDILPGHRVYRLALNGALLSLFPYDYRIAEQYMTQNLIALPLE